MRHRGSLVGSEECWWHVSGEAMMYTVAINYAGTPIECGQICGDFQRVWSHVTNLRSHAILLRQDSAMMC